MIDKKTKKYTTKIHECEIVEEENRMKKVSTVNENYYTTEACNAKKASWWIDFF